MPLLGGCWDRQPATASATLVAAIVGAQHAEQAQKVGRRQLVDVHFAALVGDRHYYASNWLIELQRHDAGRSAFAAAIQHVPDDFINGAVGCLLVLGLSWQGNGETSFGAAGTPDLAAE